MTIDQRMEKIKELAGTDIAVVMNVEMNGGVLNTKDASKSLVCNNVLNSASVILN